MKYQKKFNICRHDGEVPFRFIMSSRGYALDCPSHNKEGKCRFDDKPCKVIEYERVKK